jgi:hypothetical protein
MGMDASGGNIFCKMKVGVAFGVATVLAACTEPAQQEVRYSPATIEIAAKLLEAEIKKDIGKPAEDDLIVKRVQRSGSRVIVDFVTTDKEAVELFRSQPRLTQQLLTASIQDEMCSTADVRSLFNSGLQMDFRLADPSGRRLVESRIDKC